MKLNRYLIIGRSRSGTTLTHLILMGHPQVSALSDELKAKPLFIQGLSTFTFGNDAKEEKEKGMTALFDAITRLRENSFTMASGAKTVVNSPQLAAQLVRNLQKWMPDLKVIHVVRNDLVALYGSIVQGRKSGVMHSWYKDFNTRKVDLLKVPKF